MKRRVSQMIVTLPLGFSILQKSEVVDIGVAKDLLSTKKQQKYTTAERCVDTAVLTRHVLTCPFCGGSIPAYQRFADLSVPKGKPGVSKNTVTDWAVQQTSLFEQEQGGYDEQVLTLNSPFAGSDYICKYCGYKSKSYDAVGSFDVYINQTRQSLEIKYRVTNINEIISIAWPAADEIAINSVELYLSLTFNFKNGHTFIKVGEQNARAAYTLDISFINFDVNKTERLNFVLNNKVIKSIIDKAFKARWNGAPLPFTRRTRTLEKYIVMTRFIGYPTSFYFAIPYRNDSYKVDADFYGKAKTLHKATNVPLLYSLSQMPNYKSLKNMFYETPGLFFYMEECEVLYKVINNRDLFRCLLYSVNNYKLLSILHTLPRLVEYFRDFVSEKSAKSLVEQLCSSLNCIYSVGITYCVMSEHAQKVERKRWKGIKERDCFFEFNTILDRLPFSIPVSQASKAISYCVINLYAFIPLYTSREYITVGKALHNCLVEWYKRNNPIIAIAKSGMILAAIEVSWDCTVLQIHLKENASFPTEGELFDAYQLWCARFNLSTRQRDLFAD